MLGVWQSKLQLDGSGTWGAGALGRAHGMSLSLSAIQPDQNFAVQLTF